MFKYFLNSLQNKFRKPISPEPKTYILFDRISKVYYPIYKEYYIGRFRSSDGSTTLQKYCDNALFCNSEKAAQEVLDEKASEAETPRCIMIEYTPKIRFKK
jgi:hypothetical protein